LDTTISYATADGTGHAGADYQNTNGAVVIPAGSISRTITIPVIANTTPQNDRTFVVNLSTPANATLGAKSTGTATILDDDGPDSTINDVSGPDGAGGTTPFTFTVLLSVPAPRVATVASTTMDRSNAQVPT